MLQNGSAHLEQVPAAAFDAEEVFYLRHNDQDGRGWRESRAHGHRYEIDDDTQAEETH